MFLLLALLSAPAYADRAAAHYHRGLSLKQQGDIDGALKAFAEALVAREDYAAAHYSIGILYRQKGAHKKAVRHLQRASELDGNNAKILYSLGLAQFSAGERDAATKTLIRAADLSPKDPKILGQAGVILIRTDPARAIGYLTRAVKLDSSDVNNIHQLGLAYRKTSTRLTAPEQDKKRSEHLKQAEKYLRWAASKKQSAAIEFDLGVLYRRLENEREAIIHYQRAVGLDPKMAAAYWDLGHVLRRADRFGEAAAAFEKYIELRAGTKSAKIARERIKEIRAQKKGHK